MGQDEGREGVGHKQRARNRYEIGVWGGWGWEDGREHCCTTLHTLTKADPYRTKRTSTGHTCKPGDAPPAGTGEGVHTGPRPRDMTLWSTRIWTHDRPGSPA